MSFVSTAFITFAIICIAGYYLIPKQYQWVWLLVFSYIYYLAAGPAYVFFLLFSTAITFFGGLRAEMGSKAAVPVVLLLDFGALAFVKYTNFVLGSFAGILGREFRELKILLPLGISFYTFQTAGYLLDVYWKRCKAERSFPRFMLFASFFPQIMQGPISRYGQLAGQLYAEHDLDLRRIEGGMYRIAWGFFKKMVIADNAALYVSAVFDQYTTLRGYGLLGVLMYSAQLYADFSGGIDIVIGIAECLGITLAENFRQPFFATSIGDFWHRWHITLGTWMKDYVFYPISLSNWMGSFGKWCRKRLGKNVGRAMPICVGNIIVFLIVGIWHGPAWHYIVYGLYNGLIIGISGLLAKNFRDWKKRLKINDKAAGFHMFQIIRTFVLVNISWYLDCSGSVGQALMMFKDSILRFKFSINVIDAADTWSGSQAVTFACIVFGCLVVFVHSLLAECGVDVRDAILARPVPVRGAVLFLLLASLVLIGNQPLSVGGFIYANF
ncbi:MAG: MBOAT family O-acyltransferase [Lachnospiraceae bacterium]|nr:MBOAT family O-acyltransferase [Lachnospiraceae bacterium]